ncbi:hypothetical protein [Actinacidiphila yeochonensis]|uniref:hypothetical protein n=1 Tax=Actinacidiphila yeochonensis TaxID=89050 RepID=UPI00055EFC4D|nr:hypothetical protein [Actinacidiphila yeochonensis]
MARGSGGVRRIRPRHPVRVGLGIPVCLVLLPGGGALSAFGGWYAVLGVVLCLFGALWLIAAVTLLCPRPVVRWLALVPLLVPLVAVPVVCADSAQAAVLRSRGVVRHGVVTGVETGTGRTTTYSCEVRYDDPPPSGTRIDCDRGDRVGERVTVLEDPEGRVDPELAKGPVAPVPDASDDDAWLAAIGDLCLLVLAGGAVAVSVPALRRVPLSK